MIGSPADATLPATSELERLWLEPRDLTHPPRGAWRGTVIGRIDNAGARRPLHRVGQHLLFERMPWGIDFDRARWFFHHRRFAAGHFRIEAQRSRWRDTESFALHYEISRLPRPIRAVLYDEIKPWEPDRMIGIGGVNAERDEGDHFWFVLDRVR